MSPTQDPRAGLSEEEAARRLALDGPNELPPLLPPQPMWLRLLRQMGSPLLMIFHILVIGCFLAVGVFPRLRLLLWAGVALETFIVGAGCVLAWQEQRHEELWTGFRALLPNSVSARRGGRMVDVPERALVRGDVVQLRMGDKVPADLEVLEAGEGARADVTAMRDASDDMGDDGVVPVRAGDELAMATLLIAGSVTAVVAATGGRSRAAERVLQRRAELQAEYRRARPWWVRAYESDGGWSSGGSLGLSGGSLGGEGGSLGGEEMQREMV